MNIVSYIRVSGRGQLDGDGPDRQRDSVIAFVHANKLNHSWEFFERGVSGTTEAMDRKAFGEMMEWIESHRGSVGGEISAIVVERLDRLARDLMVQEFLLKECRDRGIQVFAADVGLIDQATNGGDPTRKLIRQVLGAVAEFAKSELVLKLAKARNRIREKTGRCEGRKPYGARLSEVAVLKAIRTYRENGFSFAQVAQFLNDSQLPSQEGKRWTRQMVFNVSKRVTKKEKA